MRRSARFLASLLLVVGFVVAPAQLAAADHLPDPDISDFTDNEGNIDLAGYVAALTAARADHSGELPRTGSDVGTQVGYGVGGILLGSALVAGAIAHRRRAAAA